MKLIVIYYRYYTKVIILWHLGGKCNNDIHSG